MDEVERGRGDPAQPTWTVTLEGEGEQACSPGLFVEVRVTHRLEVTDREALRSAVEALDGPPRDDLEQRLRQVPANLVGRLFQGPLPLPDLPGVVPRGSGLSVGEYAPATDP